MIAPALALGVYVLLLLSAMATPSANHVYSTFASSNPLLSVSVAVKTPSTKYGTVPVISIEPASSTACLLTGMVGSEVITSSKPLSSV